MRYEPACVKRRDAATAKCLRVLDELEGVLGPEWSNADHSVRDWAYLRFPAMAGARPHAAYVRAGSGAILVWVVEDAQILANGDVVATPPWSLGHEIKVERLVGSIDDFRMEVANACPLLDADRGLGAIYGLVVFTSADERTLQRVRGVVPSGSRRRLLLVPGTDLAQKAPGFLRNVLRYQSSVLDEEAATELVELAHAPRVRRSEVFPDSSFTPQQRQVVANPDGVRMRRIRGPAGSGKTMVLAARAVELARDGKSVLVLHYTKALGSFIWNACLRHATEVDQLACGCGKDIGAAEWCAPYMQSIDVMTYNTWARHVFAWMGSTDLYRRQWASSNVEAATENVTELLRSMTDLFQGVEPRPTWDAILVDEGQNFRASWWHAVRGYLAPGGEMLLVKDRTQDVYERHDAQHDTSGLTGFRGPWIEFNRCYRLPPATLAMALDFAETFLENDVIEATGDEGMLHRAKMRWIHVRDEQRWADAIVARSLKMLDELAAPGTSFIEPAPLLLTTQDAVGREAVTRLRAERPSLDITDTFVGSRRSKRKSQVNLGRRPAAVRATTVHGIQGWESPFVVLALGNGRRKRHARIAYTGLTRLRKREAGSLLTVVSTNDAYSEWARDSGHWDFSVV